MQRNIVFSLLGLVLGLVFGFKAANSGYRREAAAATQSAALKAAAQLSTGGGAAAGHQGQDTGQALAVIEKARANPQDLSAQLEAVKQFMQIQRPEGALEFLVNANRLKPADPEIMADLSESYFFSQKFDEAIMWGRRALKGRGDLHVAKYYLMASLIQKKESLSEAEQLLAQLETLKPGDGALAQARELLRAAQSEAKVGGAKTTLSHGPEAPRGGKP